MVFLENVYYIIIVAWTLFYIMNTFFSLGSGLPWSDCEKGGQSTNFASLPVNKDLHCLGLNEEALLLGPLRALCREQETLALFPIFLHSSWDLGGREVLQPRGKRLIPRL